MRMPHGAGAQPTRLCQIAPPNPAAQCTLRPWPHHEVAHVGKRVAAAALRRARRLSFQRCRTILGAAAQQGSAGRWGGVQRRARLSCAAQPAAYATQQAPACPPPAPARRAPGCTGASAAPAARPCGSQADVGGFRHAEKARGAGPAAPVVLHCPPALLPGHQGPLGLRQSEGLLHLMPALRWTGRLKRIGEQMRVPSDG